MEPQEPKKLYRSISNKFISGVCGGVGEYFNIDPNIIRVLWLVFAFMWGLGILLYLAAIVIVPLNPNLSEKKTKDRIDRRSMWGIILIVLGLLFLLGHYGCRLLPWHIWFGFGLLWPLGFIILGLMLIFKPYKVTSTNADSSQIPRLYRIYEGRILLGIAGGTAEYFNLDYSLVRLLWILFALLSGGLGILVYLFMYFIIPEKSFKITKQETQDDSQK